MSSDRNREALPINSMTDGDSHRVADALRQLNHTLVAKNIPNDKVRQFAEQLEALATEFAALTDEERPRDFGQIESDEESAAGTGYEYGAGNALSYRPVSGKCNTLAPPVKYFKGDDGLSAEVTFGPAYEGPPGLVHGGYIAACMDEVFGIAMTHSGLDVPCMTGTLKVIYRAPVPLNQTLTYKAWLKEEEGRKVFMQCVLTDPQGNMLCEGETIFLKIDPDLYASFSG